MSTAQVHSANGLGLPCGSRCVSGAEQASAGRRAVPSLIAQLGSVMFSFNTREYSEGSGLLRTPLCRMSEVTALQSSGAAPLWSAFPSLLAYPRTTSQTGEHVAPRLHRVLSVNTLSFRSFSFRLSCFQAKTNLLYYYPQLISYFPQNHASLHLSSLSLMYKFT